MAPEENWRKWLSYLKSLEVFKRMNEKDNKEISLKVVIDYGGGVSRDMW
jgi:hypothetical protein